MPPVAEMYPPQFNSWVEVSKVTEQLEGAGRPGHFRGVATAVAKLFNIVQPTRAYFGQIQRTAREKPVGVEIDFRA